jgi:hypothetical protein
MAKSDSRGSRCAGCWAPKRVQVVCLTLLRPSGITGDVYTMRPHGSVRDPELNTVPVLKVHNGWFLSTGLSPHTRGSRLVSGFTICPPIVVGMQANSQGNRVSPPVIFQWNTSDDDCQRSPRTPCPSLSYQSIAFPLASLAWYWYRPLYHLGQKTLRYHCVWCTRPSLTWMCHLVYEKVGWDIRSNVIHTFCSTNRLMRFWIGVCLAQTTSVLLYIGCSFNQGGKYILTCCDQHFWQSCTWQEVTTSRARFPKPVEQYSLLLIFGYNIVASEGETWKRYRKISAPAFSDVRGFHSALFGVTNTTSMNSKTTDLYGTKRLKSCSTCSRLCGNMTTKCPSIMVWTLHFQWDSSCL